MGTIGLCDKIKNVSLILYAIRYYMLCGKRYPEPYAVLYAAPEPGGFRMKNCTGNRS